MREAKNSFCLKRQMKRLMLLLWLTLLWLPAIALSEESVDTDAFREEQPAMTPSEESLETSASREEEMFGAASEAETGDYKPAGVIAQMEASLDEREATFDIGGWAYWRLDGYIYEEHTLNSDPLLSPSFFDIYFDARPNTRLRGYAKTRINYDFTTEEDSIDPLGLPREESDFELDQMWLKCDISRKLYLTMGLQRIKWGSGRFWNPTDFLNRQHKAPLDIFDTRLGVGLLKLHLPIEAQGWNLYAVVDLEEASTLAEIGGALRAEILFGLMELSLSAALRKDQPLRLGADISLGLWEFDLHGEVALMHRVKERFWRGDFDIMASTFPAEYHRRRDWIPQAVAGAEISIKYSDQDSIFLGLEYFYNDAGYKDDDLYVWLLFQGEFDPFYMGKHYAAAYANLLYPGSWNNTIFTLSFLGNLSDQTYISRLDYRVRVLTYLDFNLYTACHFGRTGEFRLSFDLPPLNTPVLLGMLPEQWQEPAKEGFSLPPIAVEIGFGLSFSF